MTGLSDICPHLSLPVLSCALMGFGLLIGILTGLFGVGGGFMIVPLLNLIFGIDWRLAVGSSLAFIIGTSAAGTARHLRLNNVEPKTTLILGGAAVFGAIIGADLLEFLSRALGQADSQRFGLLMQGIFIVLLLATAVMLFRGSHEHRRGPALLQRLPLRPRVHLAGAGLAGVSLPGLCAVGVSVGVLTGLLGIGGGVLFMPLLILVVGLGAHQAVGTSLGVMLFSSIAGTLKHAVRGHVSLWVAMPLLVGSAVGIQIGASICRRLKPARLRRSFALLVVLVVLALLWSFVGKIAATGIR